jgi:hypothetical protein
MNASKMGTGKTRETLVALEFARTVLGVKGSFDPILAPRSCIGQWVEEGERTFAPIPLPTLVSWRQCI